ncbi:MAG: hypothetical protein M1823_000255 [Watsoniomyces obsoletus]|nr:MAG: hypothetical protein M1823_000255 [Watsoniomyces obsoletus]
MPRLMNQLRTRLTSPEKSRRVVAAIITAVITLIVITLIVIAFIIAFIIASILAALVTVEATYTGVVSKHLAATTTSPGRLPVVAPPGVILRPPDHDERRTAQDNRSLGLTGSRFQNSPLLQASSAKMPSVPPPRNPGDRSSTDHPWPMDDTLYSMRANLDAGYFQSLLGPLFSPTGYPGAPIPAGALINNAPQPGTGGNARLHALPSTTVNFFDIRNVPVGSPSQSPDRNLGARHRNDFMSTGSTGHHRIGVASYLSASESSYGTQPLVTSMPEGVVGDYGTPHDTRSTGTINPGVLGVKSEHLEQFTAEGMGSNMPPSNASPGPETWAPRPVPHATGGSLRVHQPVTDAFQRQTAHTIAETRQYGDGSLLDLPHQTDGSNPNVITSTPAGHPWLQMATPPEHFIGGAFNGPVTHKFQASGLLAGPDGFLDWTLYPPADDMAVTGRPVAPPMDPSPSMATNASFQGDYPTPNTPNTLGRNVHPVGPGAGEALTPPTNDGARQPRGSSRRTRRSRYFRFLFDHRYFVWVLVVVIILLDVPPD